MLTTSASFIESIGQPSLDEVVQKLQALSQQLEQSERVIISYALFPQPLNTDGLVLDHHREAFTMQSGNCRSLSFS